ncbi:MAG TPA: LytTR family DNA-binding domain-containing protein, partial [Actinomycetota bacterium]|nr:LytTR family DNA-binding domain-containing protein [Actinomycetota bacterium]
ECDTAREAIEVGQRARVDLVFLETVLPDMDGFELARLLRAHVRIGLVFVTGQGRRARQAFDVHAIDFVLKPVRAERLREALAYAGAVALLDGDRKAEGTPERLMALLDHRDAQRQRWARLLIRRPDGACLVKTATIDWIEAAGKLVKVHIGKRVLEQRAALATVERQLDPEQFLRISRSVLVNIDRIREIQPWFNGEHIVILDEGTRLSSSRRHRAGLRRLLGKADEH